LTARTSQAAAAPPVLPVANLFLALNTPFSLGMLRAAG
jgi:hypothetical protein